MRNEDPTARRDVEGEDPMEQLDETAEDFAALFEKTFKEPERLKPGAVVEAMIVRVTNEWIFLDVGRKGEGYLDRKELSDDAGNLTVKEGDKVRAYYLPSSGHEMHFTTRIGTGPGARAQLEDARKNGIPVQGTVLKEVKGGFEVRVGGGVRAFCPFSQMGLRRDENRADCGGKTYTFKITECGDRNVVLSRRSIVEEERRDKARALKESLQEGMRVTGTVTSLQKFGAFVDIGGVEGLIPVSEIAWTRTENVGDKLSVGQQVEVIIKRLDWDNSKHSFSLREALPDPWERAVETWPLGSYHVGLVSRLAPFGAFVTMGDGIDGLIHISKLGAGRRIAHPREVLQEGQSVEVRIEGVDPSKKKLSLSLAELSRAQEEEEATLQAYRQQAQSSTGSLGTLGEILQGQLGKNSEQ